MTPRLTSAAIHWETPVAEPPFTGLSRRTWRLLDRAVAKQIADIDAELRPAAGAGKCWERIDYLLDERLMVRSPDAMASGPIVPRWLR